MTWAAHVVREEERELPAARRRALSLVAMVDEGFYECRRCKAPVLDRPLACRCGCVVFGFVGPVFGRPGGGV